MSKFNELDCLKTLEEYIEKYGLPLEIGARGWIYESQDWNYEGAYIGTSTDELKGWIAVQKHSDDETQNFDDAKTVLAIVTAYCEGSVDETDLIVELDGEHVTIELLNEDGDGKAWNWNGPIHEDDLDEYIRDKLGLDEDDDVDTTEFLWEHCENTGGETEYNLCYGVATVEWPDGHKIIFELKDGKTVIRDLVNGKQD